MNNAASRKSELRPLPMRISQLQFERLQAARARDGLSVQEHIRRALDLYLNKIERTPTPSILPATDISVYGEPTVPIPPAARASRAAPPRVRSR